MMCVPAYSNIIQYTNMILEQSIFRVSEREKERESEREGKESGRLSRQEDKRYKKEKTIKLGWEIENERWRKQESENWKMKMRGWEKERII